MQQLTNSHIIEQLKALQKDWQVIEGQLQLRIETKDFQESLKLVNQIGGLAEEINHHPRLCFTYGELEIGLTTHEVKGLTKLDFKLAQQIEQLF